METKETSVKEIADVVEKIFEQNGWNVSTTSGRFNGLQIRADNPETGYQTDVDVKEGYIISKDFGLSNGALSTEEPGSPLAEAVTEYGRQNYSGFVPVKEAISEYARENGLKLAQGYLIDFH